MTQPDLTLWLSACQNTLDAAVELATVLDEGITDPRQWPAEAVEYARMILEDNLTAWEDD